MSYTMSVDRVIQLARCDDFPEAKIREMFAQYSATELPPRSRRLCRSRCR